MSLGPRKDGQSSSIEISSSSNSSAPRLNRQEGKKSQRKSLRRLKAIEKPALGSCEQEKYDDTGSIQTSNVLADERGGNDDSGNNGIGTLDDKGISNLPRGTSVHHNKVSRIATKERRSSPRDRLSSQPQEASRLSQVAADGCSITNFVFKLSKRNYPIWKWLIIVYMWVLFTSYFLSYLHWYTTKTLSSMCSVPIIGSHMSFCTGLLESKDRSIEASKVATSQEELTVVIDQVGQNFEIARDIVHYEFTLHDLRIRVEKSNLTQRKEIVQELDSLMKLTKETTKNLSRFTVRIRKSTDAVVTFDNHAAKRLENIIDRQRMSPKISARVISLINPLAVLRLTDPNDSEELVKRVFTSTATQISGKVKSLTKDSIELIRSFDSIQGTLDRIKELVVEHIGDLPRNNVLSALWIRLARSDDHEAHKSHGILLTDMISFYKDSAEVMREITAALLRVETEMTGFRDEYATPTLIQDRPLEVMVDLFKRAGQGLDVKSMQLESVEAGERRLGVNTQKAETRTITTIR